MKIQKLVCGWVLALAMFPAIAALNVFATVPEWGALAQAVGGKNVSVFTATTALQDPHRIEAKPSLIARARKAQLVVATGAELEIGWLPMVQRESGNAAIQSGQPGYFEAASFVKKLEVPARLDRADGDVHAQGNPHIQLDPRLVLKVAEPLAKRMAELDPSSAAEYQQSFDDFAKRWKAAMADWEKRAAPLRGAPVLVQHKSFTYLLDWLGMREVGTLEPKPGVEPTSGQLAEIVARQKLTPAKMILRPGYQYDATARWVGDHTGLAVVTLAFTVGGTPEANDLFGLFDDTINRLLKGQEGR
jgi:zinc/manganese transport system substrate-binding protein